MEIRVDSDALLDELRALATFSPLEPPAVTRVVFTEDDRRARAYVRRLAEAAGLHAREDAVGNAFFRLEGTAPDLPAVATGSHLDAIPNAGMYDGTVGVLGAIEAVLALRRSGFRPRRSIEIVLFTAEEPTRFGLGCLGSRLLSGSLDAERARGLRDAEGVSLDAARTRAGFEGPLEGVALSPGRYDAFVELHIEQGPILEREGVPIGVVTDIAAPASARVEIVGEGGHAGGVLMADRRDALVAAARIVAGVEAAARDAGSPDAVATVGLCDVFPGAVNSIPSRVALSLDVRDVDRARRDRVLATVERLGEEVAVERGVGVAFRLLNADPPARSDPRVVAAVEAACVAEGLGFRRMVSRAYHDSLFMSLVAPTAMIFIPCRHGVSHRPDEFASPEAIADGVRALARTLATLAGDSAESAVS